MCYVNQGEKQNVVHKTITEFETHWLAISDKLETLSQDDTSTACFRHDLVQKDCEGHEHVVITWTCLDVLEEYDYVACSWQTLSYEESREFIETLLVRWLTCMQEAIYLSLVLFISHQCTFELICASHSV